MRIVLIADTHNHTPDLPDGDILVHAGDATIDGTRGEIKRFDDWLGSLNYKHIIFTPGNHDFLFDTENILENAITLINESTEIDGVVFWGSPYSVRFGDWAFMEFESDLKSIWQSIPDKVDVLITHCPPKGILDYTVNGQYAGSQSLLERIKAVRPKLHVFGHIHEMYGSMRCDGTLHINASIVNDFYQQVNKPFVIDV